MLYFFLPTKHFQYMYKVICMYYTKSVVDARHINLILLPRRIRYKITLIKCMRKVLFGVFSPSVVTIQLTIYKHLSSFLFLNQITLQIKFIQYPHNNRKIFNVYKINIIMRLKAVRTVPWADHQRLQFSMRELYNNYFVGFHY